MNWKIKIDCSGLVLLIACWLIYGFFIVPTFPDNYGVCYAGAGYFLILVGIGYLWDYLNERGKRNE